MCDIMSWSHISPICKSEIVVNGVLDNLNIHISSYLEPDKDGIIRLQGAKISITRLPSLEETFNVDIRDPREI